MNTCSASTRRSFSRLMYSIVAAIRYEYAAIRYELATHRNVSTRFSVFLIDVEKENENEHPKNTPENPPHPTSLLHPQHLFFFFFFLFIKSADVADHLFY